MTSFPTNPISGDLVVGSLRNRFVVLGVCAGIAAYKSVEICRRLMDAGAYVAPILTPDARHFVGPMTFSALASEPARVELFDPNEPLAHTRLAARAELVIVAPATADFIARYSHGMANDLLSSTLLATTAPVVICPAMHTEMWDHPATRDNIHTLGSRGVTIVPPATGRLAGGDAGPGRLAEAADIIGAAVGISDTMPQARRIPRGNRGRARLPKSERDLDGISVLVTAGGTREPIDPVRFIGNRSSGKQGHALALEAASRGALVTLVTTQGRMGAYRRDLFSGIEIVNVETAQEMADAVMGRAADQKIVIMAAAVADFRPKDSRDLKIAKSSGPPEIVLVPTTDILSELTAARAKGTSPEDQVIVGFAAETHETLERAKAKLIGKGADFIVANDVTQPGAGFEYDTNLVWIISADGGVVEVPLSDKRKVAQVIFDVIRAKKDGPGSPAGQ